MQRGAVSQPSVPRSAPAPRNRVSRALYDELMTEPLPPSLPPSPPADDLSPERGEPAPPSAPPPRGAWPFHYASIVLNAFLAIILAL
eukprot:5326301-Pleurochrysis_carterae.AAC.1